MSLDQVSKFVIAPYQNNRANLATPAATIAATPGHVDVLADTPNSLGVETRLLWVDGGHQGLDMPAVSLTTRPVPAGAGEYVSSYRYIGRRVSMKLSGLISSPAAYEALGKAIANTGPFGLAVEYLAAAGKDDRSLPRCYYMGGLDRTRQAAGRTTFNLRFFTEWPFWVDETLIEGYSTGGGVSQQRHQFTTGSTLHDFVWGIRAKTASATTNLALVKVGSPITGDDDPDAWRWNYNPTALPAPPTPFGSSNPSGLMACFSPPFAGVYAHHATAGDVELSSGRVFGAQPAKYLTAATGYNIYTHPAGEFDLFYWQNHHSL